MRHFLKLQWLMVMACLSLLTGYAQAVTTVNFTLPTSATTSAGVYKSDGTLVRTLWRKVSYTAGPHTVTWDDLDDAGVAAPAGNYQVRLLYHNVNHVWEGTIGNTASVFTGNIRRGYQVMSDMAADGTNIFSAMGYNEGQPGLQRFASSAPQALTYTNPSCITTSLDFVATDGVRYYLANTSGIDLGLNQTFVYARNVSNNSAYNFPAGTSLCQQYLGSTCYPEHYFPNIIDTDGGKSNPASGIAVQKTGNILAVSHRTLNQVKLFDKLSGNLLGSVPVTSPRRIAFTSTGDLWVVTGTTVVRYNAATLGGTNTIAATISGFVSPQCVAVHPTNNNIVMVADAGISQQVKAFDSVGTPLWTYGTLGGYPATGPDVTYDKFAFTNNKTFITILTDGSFWVSDGKNDRVLHFTASRDYIDQIMYLPANYVTTCDPNTPSRVIGHSWLEFEVDYSKPLLPGDPSAAGGNNSWKLVKNWGFNLASQYNTPGAGNTGINTVVTFNNGRVYGLIRNTTTGNHDVVELPPTGYLRPTGKSVDNYGTLYSDGSLGNFSGVGTGSQNVTRQAVTGYDASFNPIWAAATTIASAPKNSKNPQYRGAFSGPTGPRFPKTSSNVVVSFDQSVGTSANTGMHLGGMNLGGTAWLWKASPAINGIDYRIPANQEGSFDIGSGTQYGGNQVHTVGRNIIYGYHGEFWMGGQANQFMHFWDDGLFVGQFGTPATSAIGKNAVAGVAGNSFSHAPAQVGADTYYWINDESNHGGIHRWKLDNLSSITEITGDGPQGGTINVPGATGLKAQYYDGGAFNTLVTTRTDPTVNFNWGNGSPMASVGPEWFSVRWTGKVVPAYSETYTFKTTTDDGVRLWVNGQQLINKWTIQNGTWSGSIALQAGQQYDIKMEYYENAGGALAKLEWQSPSRSLQVIPQASLIPAP